MITGTYHFRSKPAAVEYYGDAREVDEALAEGRIAIGEPEAKDGQRIVMIDGGLRYGLEDGLPFREGDTIKTVCGRNRITFNQMMFDRVTYCPKPWALFLDGTASLRFATIEEAGHWLGTRSKPSTLDPDQIAALITRVVRERKE